MSLHRELKYSVKNYDKGEKIYSANQKAEGFFFLESGLVALYRNTESGKEHLMRVYGPGDYFGFRSLFSDEQYHLTTRSLLSSSVHHIKAAGIYSLDVMSPTMLKALLSNVCHELGEAEARLSNVAAYSAKVRIIDAIVCLFTRFSHYPWTSREVAEYSGTDTQTVIRYSKYLKEQNFLDPKERKIKPVDINSLISLREDMILK
jgi:CRP-like cAMP-binding protein